MPERIAYKIMSAAELQQMQRDGVFHGSPADIADGYIHLSCGSQVADTLDKHFSGVDGLMVRARWTCRAWKYGALGALARGAALSAHGLLPAGAVVSVATLERPLDGAVKLPA